MTIKTRAAVSAFALSMVAIQVSAGDIDAGASAFTSQCQNCHNVVDSEGEVLAGRANVRTGPNLYGVVGRQAGTMDFRYGASLVEAGEEGLVWDAENMVPYLIDPNSFLRETLDNNRARSQMSFRVRDEGTANDIIAFLAQFGAAEKVDEEEDTGS